MSKLMRFHDYQIRVALDLLSECGFWLYIEERRILEEHEE